MRKASYWIIIVVLILLIIGLAVFFIWYIQKENIFKRLDNELLIDSKVQDYISTSWENDYIYWLQKNGQNTNLLLMQGDGSNPENALSGDVNWQGAGNIEISPEAKYYAYICSETEKSICLYDRQANELSKLKDDSEIRDLSWKSDGSELIFISKTTSDNNESIAIATINIDGQNYQEIVSDANVPGIPQAPQYFPTEEKILFVSTKENGDQGIYSVNQDGSDIKAIVDSEKRESEAKFSPDGKKIIYTYTDSENQIYSFDLETNESTQLTSEGNNGSPSYSPDGNRIVYISDRDQAGIWEIYTMNTDGSDQQRLTSNSIDDITPRWFRKKITVDNFIEKIQNTQEIVEQYLNAKIAGDLEKIKEYIKPESSDNMDLYAPYENLFLNKIISYNIVAEKVLDDNNKEYEVDLNYLDTNFASEKLFYRIEKINDNWYLADVSLPEEETEDMEGSPEITTGNISNDSADLQLKQDAVNDGNDQWRLDPYEVAKQESDAYGFSQSEDQFTLISKIDLGDYSGTGEATVEVVHQGETYIIQLIQPIKAGSEGIWVINSIAKK